MCVVTSIYDTISNTGSSVVTSIGNGGSAIVNSIGSGGSAIISGIVNGGSSLNGAAGSATAEITSITNGLQSTEAEVASDFQPFVNEAKDFAYLNINAGYLVSSAAVGLVPVLEQLPGDLTQPSFYFSAVSGILNIKGQEFGVNDLGGKVFSSVDAVDDFAVSAYAAFNGLASTTTSQIFSNENLYRYETSALGDISSAVGEIDTALQYARKIPLPVAKLADIPTQFQGFVNSYVGAVLGAAAESVLPGASQLVESALTAVLQAQQTGTVGQLTEQTLLAPGLLGLVAGQLGQVVTALQNGSLTSAVEVYVANGVIPALQAGDAAVTGAVAQMQSALSSLIPDVGSSAVSLVANAQGTITALKGTAAAFAQLTQDQIVGLAGLGVTQFQSTEAVVLTAPQVLGFELAGSVISAPNVILSDTPTNVESYTSAQIAALLNIGVTEVDTSTSPVAGFITSGELRELMQGASSTTISLGGTEAVLAGGTTTSDTVLSGGVQIASGGIAIATTVSFGGSQLVEQDGTTSRTLVLSGASEVISSGGTALHSFLLNGGSGTVSSGGSTSSTIVEQGSVEVVSAGATASGTNVEGGGAQYVLGGMTSGTIVSGGITNVSGGVQNISGGGAAFATVVASGGEQLVFAGSAISAVLSNGGSQILSETGVASGTIVLGGGEQVVSQGGKGLFTVVSAAGSVVVSKGGLTSGMVVSSYGSATVSEDGIASGTVVLSTGLEYVLEGGDDEGTILSGGLQFVSSGSTVANTTISSGGVQFILSGADVGSSLVLDGGSIFVDQAGVTAGANVLSGGKEFVAEAGMTVGTVVSTGGFEFVSAGGSAVNTFVLSGGTEIVSGGITSATYVQSGGTLDLIGAATEIATTVSSGGTLEVGSGHVEANLAAGNGVTLTVLSGGTASGTRLTGGNDVVSTGGTAYAAHVAAGSTDYILGGTASGATVGAGGTQYVSGGTTSGTGLSSGGQQILFSGSTTSTTVSNAGSQWVAYAGEASGTVVSGGGVQFVYSAGTATGTTVSAGGQQQVFSGGMVRGTTVSSGGSQVVLSGSTASGTVILSGGTEAVLASATLSGATVAGGLLDVQAGAVTSGGIAFSGTGGTLEIDAAPGSSGLLGGAVVSGFAIDDTINLAGLAYDSAGYAKLLSGNVLDVHEDGTDALIQLDRTQSFAGEEFVLSDPTGTDVTVQNAVCFCTGVRILTTRGEVAVEDLKVGDLAVTASGAPRPVRWIGRQEVDCRAHPRPHEVMPVRVAAGALGEGRPARDLRVSPGHALCLDMMGEVLVPAGALVNGATVVQEDAERITYWHVELDGHDLLLADGAPAESYMDTGNRRFFATGEGALDPARALGTLERYCRPFHDAGPLVRAARHQLRARAVALGWQLGAERLGDMHLVCDGQRIEPEAYGCTACFAVPASVRDVWLCSDAGVPLHGADNPSADRRRLGLCVGRLAIEGGGLLGARSIGPDDTQLGGAGWHGAEPDHRWTDGRARLDPALWVGCRGLFFLRVELAQSCVPSWRAPGGVALSEAPGILAEGEGMLAGRGLRLAHVA